MLRPMLLEPVPAETARIARAAFPQGHRYLRLADELDTLFTDHAFRALFPTHGPPAQPPWRLALVTILPFAEEISDLQAAHTVRSRIDWKYLLHLELTDPGFDASVLSAFRTRLLGHVDEFRLSWFTVSPNPKHGRCSDDRRPTTRNGRGLAGNRRYS